LIYLWICLYTLEGRNLDNMFACLHVVTCTILLAIAMLACKVAGSYLVFGSLHGKWSKPRISGAQSLGPPV